MDPVEFEEKYQDVEAFPDEDTGEDLLIAQDIQTSLLLLAKVKRLLGYVGDSALCKSVTKKERDVMQKVYTEITEFLDETAGNYDAEED